ncbi:hypothetical protein [Rosistilla oblonga]|uniref:hypothetical protein n=1 Tax=Rosistilla oblonga TaxID=2527990 RepID=UPI003A985C4E
MLITRLRFVLVSLRREKKKHSLALRARIAGVQNWAQAIKKVHSPIDEYTHDEI